MSTNQSLPPVEQVVPGLWSIPLPLPIPSLRWVYCYAIQTSEGWVLVDPGWNDEPGLTALERGLALAGGRMADVIGVIATHHHPDHLGLGERLRSEYGCWVATHAQEARAIESMSAGDHELNTADGALRSLLSEAGVPDDVIAELGPSDFPRVPQQSLARPDKILEDGVNAGVPGWDFVAIWTPGHTPGHVCLHSPSRNLLLTGDHLLPRITPNISLVRGGPVDPLSDYIASLRRVAALDATLALPAHEYRFADVSDRAHTVVAHHDDRSQEILSTLRSGAANLWQITSQLHWSRPAGSFDVFRLLSAFSETSAHMAHLQTRGLVAKTVSTTEAPDTWALSPSV